MQRGEQAFGRLSTPVSAEVVVYYKRKTQTPMQKPIFLLVRRRNGFGRLLATQPKGRKIRTGGVKAGRYPHSKAETNLPSGQATQPKGRKVQNRRGKAERRKAALPKKIAL
jgi:hypothetical protein